MTRPTTYKLYYFNARGNGEIIRQIFAVAGKSFEDVRVPKEQWLQFKKKTPFGQMPVLEVDGFQLAQTYTIARYLSRHFGLAGKDFWFQAQVDAYADQWKDFLSEIKPFTAALSGLVAGDLNKLKQEVFSPAVNKHFPIYVNAIKENSFGSGYIVGCSLTWVDLLIAEFVSNLEKIAPQILDNYPALRAHKKLIQSNPELKNWLDSRPNTAL